MSCPCPACSALPLHPHVPGKHINPATRIYPIHEWGSECGRGFVSNERFSGGTALVIERKSREKVRKFYRSNT